MRDTNLGQVSLSRCSGASSHLAALMMETVIESAHFAHFHQFSLQHHLAQQNKIVSSSCITLLSV